MAIFWYSRKMHMVLHHNNIGDHVQHNVLKLPDGKIATCQTSVSNHNLWWDDVVFVGEYDTYTVVPASSVSIVTEEDAAA